MAEKNRAIVSMQFGDGSVINAWTSFALRETFTDPLGSFDFETRPLRTQIADYRARLAKGELVTVKVNALPVGTFLICSVRRRYGRDGAVFSVNCKSVLCTPYEGMVKPTLDFRTQTDAPVSTFVLEALAPYGFTDLLGDDGANRAAITGKSPIGKSPKIVVSSLKDRQAAAQDGEAAYAFCSRIFNRLGVALRVDAEGRLILEAPDYEQGPLYTVYQGSRGGGPDGDLLLDGFEVEDSNDGQYSECTVRGVASDDAGTTDSGTPTATVTAAEMNPGRPAYTSSAAAYKPLILKDKNARDRKRCASVAKLALGMRARNAFSVNGEVDGLIAATGAVWAINTTLRVAIEVEDIDETMWILERTMMGDRDGGQKTRLKLLPLGALVLGDIPTD